jgi:branched-chain amino acid transport system ATP-binding protein
MFGSLVALSNVDLHVEKGEILGIAGPNGAGKSTLFNVISGLYPPSSGRVVFDGHDMTGLKAHQMCHRGIARTFQIPKTFPTMTVYDNIRVGSLFGDGKKDRSDEIITYLNLKDQVDRVASKLDLYNEKLVMLAAALATDCKLLLLDEPLAGLSMVEINGFLRLTRKINQEWHITIIIIEHILDMLMDVSDRMMILDNGAVIYDGAPEKVRQDRKVIEVYLGEERNDHDAQSPRSR